MLRVALRRPAAAAATAVASAAAAALFASQGPHLCEERRPPPAVTEARALLRRELGDRGMERSLSQVCTVCVLPQLLFAQGVHRLLA